MSNRKSRPNQIMISASDDERARLKKQAKVIGLTMADLVHSLVYLLYDGQIDREKIVNQAIANREKFDRSISNLDTRLPIKPLRSVKKKRKKISIRDMSWKSN